MSALRHWNFQPCSVRRRCAIWQNYIFNGTDENFNDTNRRAYNSHILLLSLRKWHVTYNIWERENILTYCMVFISIINDIQTRKYSIRIIGHSEILTLRIYIAKVLPDNLLLFANRCTHRRRFQQSTDYAERCQRLRTTSETSPRTKHSAAAVVLGMNDPRRTNRGHEELRNELSWRTVTWDRARVCRAGV